jgi:hypothetical protein
MSHISDSNFSLALLLFSRACPLVSPASILCQVKAPYQFPAPGGAGQVTSSLEEFPTSPFFSLLPPYPSPLLSTWVIRQNQGTQVSCKGFICENLKLTSHKNSRLSPQEEERDNTKIYITA